MKWVQLFLAIVEALPVLDKMFQEAAIEYTKRQKEKNNVKFIEALTKAKASKNVTDLASSIGQHLD